MIDVPEIRDVKYERDAFGVTQRSLKVLRDGVLANANRPMLVIEVHDPNAELAAFFIVALHDDIHDGKPYKYAKAVYTGASFRLDFGGEGGKGYNSARLLLKILDVPFFVSYHRESLTAVEFPDSLTYNRVVRAANLQLKNLLEEQNVGWYGATGFELTADRPPVYVTIGQADEANL